MVKIAAVNLTSHNVPGTASDAFDVYHLMTYIYCMREVLFLAYFIDNKELRDRELKLTWPKGDTSQDISFPESNLWVTNVKTLIL